MIKYGRNNIWAVCFSSCFSVRQFLILSYHVLAGAIIMAPGFSRKQKGGVKL